MDKNWEAHWIWQTEDGPNNTWMCFRKTFNVKKLTTDIVAKIAVDSKYWMWINNNLVVFEGGLNRGPTSVSGYYDKIDKSKF